MASETLTQMLPEEQRDLYTAIVHEVQPLIDDESHAQAIARIDVILQGIPVDQEHRLLRAAFLAKRGEIKLEAEYYEEAEEDIRHAMHNGMRHPTVWALAGWAQFQMDKPEKAREYFDRVLEANPDEVSALTGRALVLQDLEEPEKARADLTHAIHCDPSDGSLYAMRADVHIQLGELEQAERDLREARDYDPRDPDFALMYGRLMAAMGRSQEALEVVEEALKLDGEPTLEALLLRSHLRLVNGQGDRARADAMSASNRFPDEAFALVQLAQVQLAEGNTALALKAAERAVKLDPSLPDSYLVRGAARRLNGDEEAATEDFQRASQAPAELPMFLFGAAYDALDPQDYHATLFGNLQAQAPQERAAPADAAGGGAGGNPFGGMPGMGGGMDPMRMMGQMFDDEGNLRGPFKPLLKMAMKNAPTILKNMPPGVLKNMGGVDPEMLEQLDLDNLSPDELEAQMKQFYKMMQSGQDPMEMMRNAQQQMNNGDAQDD